MRIHSGLTGLFRLTGVSPVRTSESYSLRHYRSKGIMKRFWDKVNKTNYCWNWTASGRGLGYGVFYYEGKRYDSHRFSWFLANKEFPKLFVCHKCDNRACVRPSHLFLGTHKDNMMDASRKGRNRSKRKGVPTGRPAANRKLSPNQVLEIKNLVNNGKKKKDCADIYKVNERAIRDIIAGRTYREI